MKPIVPLALAVLSFFPFAPIASAEPNPDPDWLEPMRQVHAGFTGQQGYVALLGDSITESLAFWKPLAWDEPAPYLPSDSLPQNPPNTRWREAIKGIENRGSAHGNQAGWGVGNVLDATDRVLAEHKPECAIIMIGTNDVAGEISLDFRNKLNRIIQKCLAAHCVPILNTIPPSRDHADRVARINTFVRRLAAEHHVPLVDYYEEIVTRQPDGAWAGTLISIDGVHPTAEKINDYSPENLKVSGYALRTWVNFLAYRRVYFEVFHPEPR